MKFSRIIASMLIVVMLAGTLPVFAAGSSDAPKLYIDNTLVELENPCVNLYDTVYFPVNETFFKMGVYMIWNDSEKCWYGEGNNGEIRVKPNSNTVDIDWVDVELPSPTREIDGLIYAPIYILEDALKIATPVYDKATNSVYVEYPDLVVEGGEEFNLAKVEPTLPAGTEMFNPEWLTTKMRKGQGGKYVEYEVVDVEGMHFDKAVSVKTLPMENNIIPTANYSIQTSIPIADTEDFLAGDLGIMTFWARATQITDESGTAKVGLTFEQTTNWNKAVVLNASMTSEWQKYYAVMYHSTKSLYSGQAQVRFGVGYKPQTIEFADIHMRKFSPEDGVTLEMLNPNLVSAYKGIEEDALWRKEAHRRIEKYRKNDMVIKVTDESGNPVVGAQVNADMTAKDNEFMFGHSLNPSEYEFFDPEDSEIDRIREEVNYETGNTLVDGLDLKNEYDDYVKAIWGFNYVLSKGMRQRGHALSWDWDVKIGKMPFYDIYNYDAMYEYLMKEVKKELWLFRGRMKHWDALNEPHDSNDVRTKHGTQMYSDVFKVAKALDPKAKLYVNETGMEGHPDRNHTMRADGLVRNIINPMIYEERAPVDGVALQGHCTNYYYPQGMYQEFCKLADVADEVSYTEYSFLNGDLTWFDEHTRDSFLTVYSHPKGKAFIFWGYYDPMHWRKNGMFYDGNWNEKTGLQAWYDVMERYLADHEEGVTDENGCVTLRGLRGDYTITVKTEGAEGNTRFALSNGQNAERDNYINAVVKADGTISFEVSNEPEFYGAGPLEFRDGTEAYADYVATIGDRELIGIYWHMDQSGTRVPLTTDGLMNSYWYGENDGDYLAYELVEKAGKGDVNVQFRAVNGEVYNYKILKSLDGVNYEEIYKGSSKDDVTVPFTDAMYIKIVSDGNDYMGVSEVNINAEK